MGSAGQYSFLEPYFGQVLIFEIIPCNWNDKSKWAFCVIAVITEDGKVINNCNFAY